MSEESETEIIQPSSCESRFYKICLFYIHFNKIHHSFIKHALVLNVMMFQGWNMDLDSSLVEDSPEYAGIKNLGESSAQSWELETGKSCQLG